MTKTEQVRLILIDARAAGVALPKAAEIAPAVGISVGCANTLRRRLILRDLAPGVIERPKKHVPSKPRVRLPIGITREQHEADLALMRRVKAEWGLTA